MSYDQSDSFKRFTWPWYNINDRVTVSSNSRLLFSSAAEQPWKPFNFVTLEPRLQKVTYSSTVLYSAHVIEKLCSVFTCTIVQRIQVLISSGGGPVPALLQPGGRGWGVGGKGAAGLKVVLRLWRHFSTPTIQHFSTLTLRHSNSTALQLFDTSALQLFDTSTLQLLGTSASQQLSISPDFRLHHSRSLAGPPHFSSWIC